MSTSMFRWTEECEQDPMCVGDCDLCRKETMIDKYNEVGIPALERVTDNKAKPAEGCAYPRCDECDKYHGHYCTVPMVVSKQIFRLTDERIRKLENELTELKTLVTDEILRPKAQPKEDNPNLTWEDYFGEIK